MCFSIFLSIILILNSKIYSFEDENIELFEYSEIEKTLETVSSVSNLPDTNSKNRTPITLYHHISPKQSNHIIP